MKLGQNMGITFYEHLGKLFYAIAAADYIVHPSEYESLHKYVQAVWLKLEDHKDEHGSDIALQIEIVFDWLNYKDVKAKLCFEEFESYYKEHPTLFSKEIKELIWETSNAITEAFSRKNKFELTMLGRLMILFRE